MTDTSSTVRVSTATRLYVYVSLSLVAAIVLVPLVTTALGGFKTLGDLRLNPFGLPSEWVWSNYVDILFGERYWRQMMNSLIIAGVTSCSTTS
jgi:raffinose/stachyose/melibiose transport system permease protein